MPRLPLGDLKRAVEEQQALAGRRIENVFQCGPRQFVLRLEPGRDHWLLELNPGRTFALLTPEPPRLPDAPPVLATILRKALRGGRIEAVTLPAEDRILFVDIEGAGGRYRIVLELFPRFSNFLLLDSSGRVERVLDGAAAKRRGNPVGALYSLPPAPTLPAEETLLSGELEPGPFAVNYALERLFREEGESKTEQSATAKIEKVVERLRRTRAAVERDLQQVEDPARLRADGMKLLEGFDRMRAGVAKFEGVALDPKLQPHENVDRIFERARKAERARPALESRRREMDDLIARAEAGEAVSEAAAGSRKGSRPGPRLPYRVFTSLEGRRILVGKGGADNDQTTLKVAGPHDIFLHVRGTPGAHVIVPLQRGEEIGEQTLLDAATLALHYSKSRKADRAEITWTPRRHVSKPKGSKPGLVQVAHERVLPLRREPERLARLLMGAGEGE